MSLQLQRSLLPPPSQVHMLAAPYPPSLIDQHTFPLMLPTPTTTRLESPSAHIATHRVKVDIKRLHQCRICLFNPQETAIFRPETFYNIEYSYRTLNQGGDRLSLPYDGMYKEYILPSTFGGIT